MKLKFVPLALFLYLLCACSAPKGITYFQDANTPVRDSALLNGVKYLPRICAGDLLTITVSAIDPSAVAPFNLPAVSYAKQTQPEFNGTQDVSASQAMQSYTVDSEGFINFPVLGKIQLGGMTKQDATDQLEKKISSFVSDPIVNIQIVNFKVTVLGEVTKPGSYPVNSDRVSLLDALGLANDLTIYGNRKNVLLVRDSDGKKEMIRFDLTKSDMFDSPYFYLQQNDVLYVEPNKARKGNAKYSQNQQFNISLASTIISAISVLASLGIALLVK